MIITSEEKRVLLFLTCCTLSATHLSQRDKVRQAVICRTLPVSEDEWVCGINAGQCLLMGFRSIFLKIAQAIAKIFPLIENVSFSPYACAFAGKKGWKFRTIYKE